MEDEARRGPVYIRVITVLSQAGAGQSASASAGADASTTSAYASSPSLPMPYGRWQVHLKLFPKLAGCSEQNHKGYLYSGMG